MQFTVSCLLFLLRCILCSCTFLFFWFLFYTFSLHSCVVLCCAFKVGWVHQLLYCLSSATEGTNPMKHCVEQIRRKRTRCVFFGTGFKSGKTNHTPKFEIWKFTVQLDKKCNCTFGFAFDKLQTTMSLWCSWNERISYQPIPKCCAAGWPVLFGMVQHGSTTLSYAE